MGLIVSDVFFLCSMREFSFLRSFVCDVVVDGCVCVFFFNLYIYANVLSAHLFSLMTYLCLTFLFVNLSSLIGWVLFGYDLYVSYFVDMLISDLPVRVCHLDVSGLFYICSLYIQLLISCMST